MIEVEDNIRIGNAGRMEKYTKYYDVLYNMKSGQSFLTDDYKVVDAVRHKAWEEKIPVSYRSIKETGKRLQYRIWRK
jgi:hypothetical protein